MCSIAKRVTDVRSLVRQSIISEQNTEGFLMQNNVDDYLKDIIYPQIESMNAQIDRDIETWKAEAKIYEQEKEKRLANMQQAMETMIRETNHLLSPATRLPMSARPLKLTKLPVFGAKCNDKQIAFEWPRMADLQKPSVKKGRALPQISLVTVLAHPTKGLHGIGVTLTNGMKSDVFKAPEGVIESRQEYLKITEGLRFSQIKATV